jgi:hypothetical protein
MASDNIDVSLRLDASGYIGTAEKVAKSNRDIAASVEALTGIAKTVVNTFDEAGNALALVDTTIRKTSKGFNKFGEVVSSVTKEVNGEIVSIQKSVDVVNLAFEKQLSLRNKLKAAAQRQTQDAAVGRTRGLIERTSTISSGATQGEQRAIKDVTDSLLRLQGVAGITGFEIFNALERARSGAITYLNANTKLEKSAFRVAEAEREAGSATAADTRKRNEATKAANLATSANERLAISRRELGANLTRSGGDPDASGVSGVERSQFKSAKLAAINFATTTEKVSQLEAAILRAQAGTLTLANAFEQADFVALRFVETTANLGAAEESRAKKAKAAADATTKALEVQKQKVEEVEAARDKIRKSLELEPRRDDISDEEFRKFTRREDKFLGDVVDKESGEEAVKILEAARNGTLRLLDANTELKRDALLLAEAERELGKALRDVAAAADLQEKADREALAVQDQRIVAAKLLNDAIRQQFDVEKPGATSGEQSQFESARKALIKLAESGQVAGSTIEAALQRAINGTLTLGNTADETEEAVVRLARAGKNLGSRDAEKRAAALKKEADVRKENLKVLKKQAILQQEVSNIARATRRGVDLGAGSESELKNFVRA